MTIVALSIVGGRSVVYILDVPLYIFHHSVVLGRNDFQSLGSQSWDYRTNHPQLWVSISPSFSLILLLLIPSQPLPGT